MCVSIHGNIPVKCELNKAGTQLTGTAHSCGCPTASTPAPELLKGRGIALLTTVTWVPGTVPALSRYSAFGPELCQMVRMPAWARTRSRYDPPGASPPHPSPVPV